MERDKQQILKFEAEIKLIKEYKSLINKNFCLTGIEYLGWYQITIVSGSNEQFNELKICQYFGPTIKTNCTCILWRVGVIIWTINHFLKIKNLQQMRLKDFTWKSCKYSRDGYSDSILFRILRFISDRYSYKFRQCENYELKCYNNKTKDELWKYLKVYNILSFS